MNVLTAVAPQPDAVVAGWLLVIADLSLVLAGLTAAWITWDVITDKHQMMGVMRWVWPITALYMGPLALLAYRRFQVAPPPGKTPFWTQVFTGVTHCGAGCTLGDIVAEFAIFGAGATLLGAALYAEFAADYLLAYALGILFQYFAIAPMRGISGGEGIWAAVKADTLSLTAFEVGLFGWMALFSQVLFNRGLHPTSPVYWFMMQIGMLLGFATSYPVNWWLIRRGIKEAM
ncbi:MAG: DUF4396 domain-containing protein [Candidatus Dormibacteria bacterium]